MHVVAPALVVQPPDVGVTFCVTEGAPPLTAIVSDCVFGEMYPGLRIALAVFAGIEMVKTALDVRCPGPAFGSGALPPPPPPHAARRRTEIAISARLSNTMSPQQGLGPVGAFILSAGVAAPRHWDIRTIEQKERRSLSTPPLRLLPARPPRRYRTPFGPSASSRFLRSARKPLATYPSTTRWSSERHTFIM